MSGTVWARAAVFAAPALLLTGCATLPAAAPTVGQVLRKAEVGGTPIRVLDLVDLPAGFDASPAAQPASGWTIGDAPPWQGHVVAGDIVSITVFEIGYGLFGGVAGSNSPAGDQASGRAAPSAGAHTLPAVEVGQTGVIELPYLGRIEVIGRSADQISHEIEQRIMGYSQHAQVVVTVARGAGQAVVLSGDIRQPGRQALSPAGERLLDVIAQAGGPSNRAADSEVVLTRAGQSARVALDRLQVGAVENVRLAPGDHVALVRRTRTLTVLGAARIVSEIPFDSDTLTLAEALARAGGPLDDRADGAGVFVFRYTQQMIDGKDVEVPTIFRLNLLDPRGYFAVQKFAMRERDVVLIANARSAQFAKLVTVLNQFVSPAIAVDLLRR